AHTSARSVGSGVAALLAASRRRAFSPNWRMRSRSGWFGSSATIGTFTAIASTHLARAVPLGDDVFGAFHHRTRRVQGPFVGLALRGGVVPGEQCAHGRLDRI